MSAKKNGMSNKVSGMAGGQVVAPGRGRIDIVPPSGLERLKWVEEGARLVARRTRGAIPGQWSKVSRFASYDLRDSGKVPSC